MNFKRIEKKKKRGFTLAELSVVLALVAVVATMVTSFCLLIHQRSVISRARLDIVNEVTVIRKYAERWVDEMHEQGAVFEIKAESENNSLVATVTAADDTSTNYTFELADDRIIATMPGENADLSYGTTRIKEIKYEVFLTEDSEDTMCFFTVTALLPKANDGLEEEVYTFCIDSPIGETLA